MTDLAQTKRRYLIASLAGTLALLSIDLFLPFSWDNEIYQSMATDLARFHLLPYLGSWDQNFPGIVYIHWVSILLFGNSDFGFRLFDLTIHIGMAWMFFSLLCRWLSPRTACLAVLLYMLHYIANGDVMGGERDEFAVLFLLLGTVFLFAAKRIRHRQGYTTYLAGFGAGVALTVMFTIRPTYGTFSVVGLAFLLSSSENRALVVTFFIAGVFTVLLALIIPYVMRPGGMEQAYLSTVKFNLDIYGAIRAPFETFVKEVRTRKLFLISGFIGVLFAVRPPLRRTLHVDTVWNDIVPPHSQEQLLFLGYSLSGLLSLFVMGKYLPYHFTPFMLMIVPFAALGFKSAIAAIPGKAWRIAAITSLCTYAILRVYPLYLARPLTEAIMSGQPLETVQYEMVSEKGFQRNVELAVAAYIDRTAPADERIECATITAGVRLRTPRQCVSRFTTFYPLAMKAPNGGHPDFQQTWRRAFVDSLRSRMPYYLVIGNGPTKDIKWMDKPPSESIHEIAGFDSLILPHYQSDTTIGGYSILKRKS